MDIEDIYELIPDFICDEGCHECCKNFGVPSRTQVEDERLRNFLRKQGMEPGRAKGNTCPYLREDLPEGGCSIHPVRPFICRLYGTSINYPCTMGVEPPLGPLAEDEEAEIFHFYQKNFF